MSSASPELEEIEVDVRVGRQPTTPEELQRDLLRANLRVEDLLRAQLEGKYKELRPAE